MQNKIDVLCCLGFLTKNLSLTLVDHQYSQFSLQFLKSVNLVKAAGLNIADQLIFKIKTRTNVIRGKVSAVGAGTL